MEQKKSFGKEPQKLPADFIMYVREVPELLTESIEPPHRHGFQEIIFLEEGSATHHIDGETYDLVGPLIVLVAQGKVHQFYPQPWSRLYVVRFTNEFLPDTTQDLFCQVGQLTSVPIHTAALRNKISSLLQLLYQDATAEARNEKPNLGFRRHVLSALLAVLREEKQQQEQEGLSGLDSNFELYGKFLRQLDQDFMQQKSVEYYAEQLHITTKKLGELSKRIAGETPSRVIEKRVMLAAKRMLLYTDETVQEIAFALGYTDHSHFTRAFRKNEQTTPTNFRIKYQQA